MPVDVVIPALPFPWICGRRRRRIGDGYTDEQVTCRSYHEQDPPWVLTGPIHNLLPMRYVLSSWPQIMSCLASTYEQIRIRRGAVSRHQDVCDSHPKVPRWRALGTVNKSSTEEKYQEQAKCQNNAYPDRITRQRIVRLHGPRFRIRSGQRGAIAVHSHSKPAKKKATTKLGLPSESL